MIDCVSKLVDTLEKTDSRKRPKVLRSIVRKDGNRLVSRVDDPKVVPVLLSELKSEDERIKAAAAYALRPWTEADPSVRTYAS